MSERWVIFLEFVHPLLKKLSVVVCEHVVYYGQGGFTCVIGVRL